MLSARHSSTGTAQKLVRDAESQAPPQNLHFDKLTHVKLRRVVDQGCLEPPSTHCSFPSWTRGLSQNCKRPLLPLQRKTCYKVLPAELNNVSDEEGDLYSGPGSLSCQGPGTHSPWTGRPSADHTLSSAGEITHFCRWGLGLCSVSLALDPSLFQPAPVCPSHCR